MDKGKLRRFLGVEDQINYSIPNPDQLHVNYVDALLLSLAVYKSIMAELLLMGLVNLSCKNIVIQIMILN